MQIGYTSKFIKKYNSLDPDLKAELKEKIELFKNVKNHKQLKAHKLHGSWKGCYSFSINYKIRVVFEYCSKNEVVLLAVGDHAIYKN